MDTRTAYIQTIINLMWGEGSLKKTDGDILLKKIIEKFDIKMEDKVSC
jgi:hypothetical protein